MTLQTFPRIKTDAGLAYHRAGTASQSRPPMLLIHGVGLRLESWFPQIPILAENQAVYAIDLPGLGESAMLSENAPAISHYGDAVRRFIGDTIGEAVIVAGHSLGALITIDLAARHGEAVRAIAPMNGVFDRTPEALAAVQERAATLRATICEPWDPAVASAPVERWFGANPTGRNAEMAALCRSWLEANNRAGYAAAYTAFASVSGPAPADLAAIDCPTLFLTGERDPNSTPAMSRAMAGHVAGAQAVVVPGAAHMVGLTHIDEVNDVLLSFVDSVAG